MNVRGSWWTGPWTPLVALFGVACASGVGTRAAPATEAVEQVAERPEPTPEPAPTETPEPTPPPPVASSNGDIPVFVDGRQEGMVTRQEAERRGLTVIDLGDDWTPVVFAEHPSLGAQGRQPYRGTLVNLSNEVTGRGGERDAGERYLELYGIFPSFHVLQRRLADERRHACHEAVDNAPIEAMEGSMRPGDNSTRQRAHARSVNALRERLEEEARRRGLGSIDELASDRRQGPQLRRLRQTERTVAGVSAVQAHLRCEGYLPSRAEDGVLDAYTGQALRTWQSKNMIIALAARLDEHTRDTLVTSSREIDLISALRSLRERVIAASGLIEDGSASNSWGRVVDRQLDLDDELHWVSRLEPLEGGAPDLISQATDAAARALGWTDPAGARAWLDAHARQRQPHRYVAVRLPPRPAYHGEHMELRVEIDRGDVWYTFPYTDDGRPRGFPVNRRPTFVIYAQHEGRDIPLVRWNTTIGSWQPEVNPQGGVGMRYKESDVGPRVWRDLIASPAWLPPPGTPDDELLLRRGGGWTVHRSITGPGYDSAYGLAMVIHHMVRGDGARESDWVDNGIRSHGSVSYRSILRGYSHGCHRLFNHLAVRMTSFLLQHRRHVVRGRIPANYRRSFSPEGASEPLTLEIDTRGFHYELTPPVPVQVLEGNVRGAPSRAPSGFFPLPSQLQEAARQQLAEDPN